MKNGVEIRNDVRAIIDSNPTDLTATITAYVIHMRNAAWRTGRESAEPPGTTPLKEAARIGRQRVDDFMARIKSGEMSKRPSLQATLREFEAGLNVLENIYLGMWEEQKAELRRRANGGDHDERTS